MYVFSVINNVEHVLTIQINIVLIAQKTAIDGFRLDITRLVNITVQLVIISALDIWVNLF